MKTFWLKLGVVAVVILGSGLAVIYWHCGKQTAVKQHASARAHRVKDAKAFPSVIDVKKQLAEGVIRIPQPKQAVSVQTNISNPKAEKLYEMAVSLQKKPAGSPELSYRLMIAGCRAILSQYPDTPQAKEAEKLLQQVPEKYVKEYDERMRVLCPGKPVVAKTTDLRQFAPAAQIERYLEMDRQIVLPH